MKTTKLMAAALVVSPMILASTVQAVETKTKDSDAIVKFHPDDAIVNPKDPNDPGKDVVPMDPEDPTKPLPDPGTSGPLSLDFASKFYFGDNVISPEDKTYYAAPQQLQDGSTKANYVQVTDKRGTESGWRLTVQQNGQFKSAAKQRELTGAAITLADANTNTVSSAKAPSTVMPTITLNPTGAATTVVTALDGEGMGTWLYRFGSDTKFDESVSLFVPGTTDKLADTYNTTLTWTVTDAPVNG